VSVLELSLRTEPELLSSILTVDFPLVSFVCSKYMKANVGRVSWLKEFLASVIFVDCSFSLTLSPNFVSVLNSIDSIRQSKWGSNKTANGKKKKLMSC
jgi:hypothetical protein